ncbi:hypothetical protein PISL3812_07048 [Talaromyces islandicus]|uniref:Enoyl reductase (ER) domain-containing protein n=1 Tax=Talaromyces islandicus TaxID=28573 RepID=A0A0U1M365_TALIS|nr:hypothetical protein PISL3812_07048 [Talaromyces islandicus]
MTLPSTYTRAVFTSPGSPLTLETVPLSLPAKNEILIKVQACGVCFSDQMAQHNIMGGGFPIVPGHEIIGHVAAVGDDVKGWSVGDRIGGAWHGGHDGTCHACKKGLFQMCDHRRVNGETKDGGYAEYCKIRQEAAVKVPSHVDAAKYSPILCAGTSVFNAMRRMNVPPGSTVAIQGLGGLGHLAIQYANKFGYRVVALSRNDKKESLARGLGAHEYIDGSKWDGDYGAALQQLGGASLIVTTAPDSGVMDTLLKGLGLLGKLLILSVPGDIVVNTATMLTYGLSIHHWPAGHALDAEEAIQFTEIEDINCMIEKFPLQKANDAFAAMANGTVRFRSVITME